MFNTKQELTDWALEQFNKYGIRQPEILTEQEIKDACPNVPSWFVEQHVQEKDKENG